MVDGALHAGYDLVAVEGDHQQLWLHQRVIQPALAGGRGEVVATEVVPEGLCGGVPHLRQHLASDRSDLDAGGQRRHIDVLHVGAGHVVVDADLLVAALPGQLDAAAVGVVEPGDQLPRARERPRERRGREGGVSLKAIMAEPSPRRAKSGCTLPRLR